MNFLLVFTELVSLGITAEVLSRYERKEIENALFARTLSVLSQISGRRGHRPTPIIFDG